jgi:hypothetical protein
MGISILIHHHLGLGDHLVCNGLVRELTRQSGAEIACLIVAHNNYSSVRKMYLDEPRICCVTPGNYDFSYHDAENYLNDNMHFDSVYHITTKGGRSDWDACFYECAGVPFEKRWSAFKCYRDPGREDELLRLINPDGVPFVLVHEECSNVHYNINLNRNRLKVVKVSKLMDCNGQQFDITDWCKAIERASQVHCVDSSFIHLCCSIRGTGVYHDFHRAGWSFSLPPGWSTSCHA